MDGSAANNHRVKVCPTVILSPHKSQIFYSAPVYRHWCGLRLISCPCSAQMQAVFAGCRPSFTRSSARNPHQHSASVRSFTKFVIYAG